MSNELIKPEGWTDEQLQLIKDTVAKGATPDELRLFLYRCKSLDLDPLKPGQIYFIKYGNSPGTIVVGIEGFRSRACKTGKLTGIKRGTLRNEKGVCIGAWAEVYRSDWQHPAREEVPLSEYNTGKGNWSRMPETMIKKVCEAAALRMAFPDDLGGIYTQEEMEQANHRSRGVYPEQPDPEEGDHSLSGWKFSFGKWKQRTIEEVYQDPKNGRNALEKYVAYLDESSRKSGKPLSAAAEDCIQRIEEFIGVMENSEIAATAELETQVKEGSEFQEFQ